MTKRRPIWIFISAACIVPAVLDGLQTYAKNQIGGGGSWADVAFQSTEWLFLGALAPIPYYLVRRFPLRRGRVGPALAVHFLGAVLLCVGWATLGVILGTAIHRYPGGGRLGSAYASWLLTTLPWSVFMYFTMLGCIQAFDYFAEAREREAQQAKLAAQLADARLSALRMQLNPHFLFNSLNAIAVLVRDERTGDASRMLELLGGVLRQVLQSDNRQLVSVDEELGFIERYLAIEQVRFSDRLRVHWSIDDTVREALVPEFILQPLVENAIRHGIAKRADAGAIEIGARASNGQLILSVYDDGPGYDAESAGSGVGLANVRTRLETLYGAAAHLTVTRAERGGTLSIVHAPIRR